MRRALDAARLTARPDRYINLHGTATELNDAMEARAVNKVFGGRTLCSSTKSMTGHMLGAAGANEAAFLWLMLEPNFANGMVPPARLGRRARSGDTADSILRPRAFTSQIKLVSPR